MRLRCFLFKYAFGTEVIRWFSTSRDTGWGQQVMVQRLPDGVIEHTGHDPGAVMWMPGLADLIEAGKVEEL